MTDPHRLSNPVSTLATLFARLAADGGRYLLSVAMTHEERDAQPEPTFGGKGHSRWLTDDERAALLALPDEIERLTAERDEARANVERFRNSMYAVEHDALQFMAERDRLRRYVADMEDTLARCAKAVGVTNSDALIAKLERASDEPGDENG